MLDWMFPLSTFTKIGTTPSPMFQRLGYLFQIIIILLGFLSFGHTAEPNLDFVYFSLNPIQQGDYLPLL